MDGEQEQKMQSLGFFGIYKESFKLIFSWWKIFTLITLTLIVPLSFIYLNDLQVSNVLVTKIVHNFEEIVQTPPGTLRFDNLSDTISSEWLTFWLWKLLYVTFFFNFSFLSTSAVVNTIASVYNAREVTFKKVMSIAPKVWKRLMVTSLCTFVAVFTYEVMAMLVIIIVMTLILWVHNAVIAVTVVMAMLFLYFVGFAYLVAVCELADVVTVLEDSYGVEAMMKSKELMKGKKGLSILIFLKLSVSLTVIHFMLKMVVGNGPWRLGRDDRAVYGTLCFFLLVILFLFWVVVKTVLYFVCKSCHHDESIDKSALSGDLETYPVENEPLMKPKYVQLQLDQYHV